MSKPYEIQKFDSLTFDSEYFHRNGFVSSSVTTKALKDECLGKDVQPEYSQSTVHFHWRKGNYVDDTTPVLILLHGYPQTSYMWRHASKYFPETTPIFIPDIPGYGRSSPPSDGDKRNVGRLIIEAFIKFVNPEGPSLYKKQKVVLAGHDRGARICHRIAVDFSHNFPTLSEYPDNDSYKSINIQGVVLMDIVPTIEQWKSFAQAPNSVGSFHWPFLANEELATGMIKAYGGGKFCTEMILKWAAADWNTNDENNLSEGNALDVYAHYFDKESVIRASCKDYVAGGNEDVTSQAEDIELKRLLEVPTLVLYSKDYLGSRYNVRKAWSKWVSRPDDLLEVEAILYSGHFIAEENWDETYNALANFWDEFAF